MKTCPQCAEQIQDSAKVCRYCGHKFGIKMPRIGCFGAALISVALVFLLVKLDFGKPDRPTGQPIAISAPDLTKQLAENEPATLARLDGHLVSVTGQVLKVSTNASGAPVIHLRGAPGTQYLTVHPTDASRSQANGLAVGVAITTECERARQLLGMPIVLDCTL